MSFNEITLLFVMIGVSLPRLVASKLSHFPQLSWIRRWIYPGTCARGFISCSVCVLISVRGLLTCLTPDDTLCLLWQNGKVESVTCFDTGVTGLLAAQLCVFLCNYSCFAYFHAVQRWGKGNSSSTQAVWILMHNCLRNTSTMNPSPLSTHILTVRGWLHSYRLLADMLQYDHRDALAVCLGPVKF